MGRPPRAVRRRHRRDAGRALTPAVLAGALHAAVAPTPANTAAALTVATALVASGWWFAAEHGRWPVLPAAFMVTAGVSWLPLNKPIEGPILLTVTGAHGLTVADLLPPAVGLGAIALRVARRIGRGREPEPVLEPTPRPAPALPPPAEPRLPATARGQVPAPRHAADDEADTPAASPVRQPGEGRTAARRP